ncbi:MAG: hypothetical protein PUP92_06220 [Rhizonema sp. PD38]|nr:hypothetical protein [Rhizonema sp. PD38]
MNHLKHIQPIVIDVTPEWEGERGDGERGVTWEKKFLARPHYSFSVLLPCLYSSLLYDGCFAADSSQRLQATRIVIPLEVLIYRC